MEAKFANIRFARDITEIPMPGIISKAPEKVLNWYINKFLPYAIKDVGICDLSGYEIILPVVSAENAGLLAKITEKVKADCEELNVKAVSVESGIRVEGFFTADGNMVKAFFIKPVIDKYLKAAKINPAQAEIIVIEGSGDYTGSIVYYIYGKFNYLGIILEGSEQADYEELAAEIFDDCGLNINFGRRGSFLLKEADIIINLSASPKGYESFYKKGSCYIELSGGEGRLRDILIKRGDMLAIDKWSLEYGGEKLSLAQYEIATYLEIPDFAKYASSKNKEKYFTQAAKSIEKQNIKIRGLNI